MSLVSAKCTSCGASIKVDASKEAGICEYCNTAFITQKAVESHVNSLANNVNMNNSTGNTVNIYNNAPVGAAKTATEKKVDPIIKGNSFPLAPKWKYWLPVIIGGAVSVVAMIVMILMWVAEYQYQRFWFTDTGVFTVEEFNELFSAFDVLWLSNNLIIYIVLFILCLAATAALLVWSLLQKKKMNALEGFVNGKEKVAFSEVYSSGIRVKNDAGLIGLLTRMFKGGQLRDYRIDTKNKVIEKNSP
ncbi:MAG: hypothetical protein FWE53_03320 [Firmicutes bacterium]|nr:hypothetical protein [Bacillota bacterium]